MRKILETELGIVEEAAELMAELQKVGFFEMEKDAYHKIILDNACIRIPSLNIDLYSGLYCAYNPNTNEYEDVFPVNVVKKLGCTDDHDFISWESDIPDIKLASMYIAIKNDINIDDAKKIYCEVWKKD